MDESLEDAFDLTGRVAVVTGAASGIGRQTALTLAQAGARLALADMDGDAVAALAVEIGDGAIALRVDVADRAQVDGLAARAAQIGPVRVWANVAGVAVAPIPVTDVDEATLDRLIAVNLKGCYWGCAAAVRLMRDGPGGSIINVSSAGADLPAPGLSVYAMTKAGVNLLTKTLALEAGPANIRVNAVAPGFIDTPMIGYRFTGPDGAIDINRKAAVFADRAAMSPLGIIGEPRDIALAILYLASDASRFMTGQIIRPNGGVVMP